MIIEESKSRIFEYTWNKLHDPEAFCGKSFSEFIKEPALPSSLLAQARLIETIGYLLYMFSSHEEEATLLLAKLEIDNCMKFVPSMVSYLEHYLHSLHHRYVHRFD